MSDTVPNANAQAAGAPNLDQQPWPVAVFAHNEARGIVSCLESIAQAGAQHPLQVFVLANGCTDSTEAVVRDFARTHPWVMPVSIALGDKANAWNVFVQEVCPPCQVCFFMDGDVQALAGAFDALARALRDSPKANAAAAVPASGRGKKSMFDMVCQHHLVLGNLYALSGNFMRQARLVNARMPIGYIGEDGLVTSLSKWNLEPRGPFLKELVAPCPDARFVYRSFSLLSPRDWRTYWRRRVRYSLRHFQHELLAPLLINLGMSGMPNSVDDLYQRQAEMLGRCRARSGLDLIFDRIAIAQMRNRLAACSKK